MVSPYQAIQAGMHINVLNARGDEAKKFRRRELRKGVVIQVECDINAAWLLVRRNLTNTGCFALGGCESKQQHIMSKLGHCMMESGKGHTLIGTWSCHACFTLCAYQPWKQWIMCSTLWNALDQLHIDLHAFTSSAIVVD